MDALNIISRLPTFLLISALLSYLVWSRYRNRGSLKIESDSSLGDLLAIFFCISIILIGFPLIFLLLQGHFSFIPPEQLWQNILNLTPKFSSFLGILGIFIFLGAYMTSKGSKKEFKKICVSLFRFYMFSIIYLIASWFALLISPLRVISWSLFLLVIPLFFMVVVPWVIINGKLIEIKFKDLINKKIKQIILILAILGFLVMFTILPIFTIQEPEILEYRVYDADHRYEFQNHYKMLKVPIDVKTFGIVGAGFPFVLIDYKKYNLSLEDYNKESFKISFLINNETRPIEIIKGLDELKEFNSKKEESHGLFGIYLDENKGIIILEFNEHTVKKEGIEEIYIEGLVPEKINQTNFSYSDNTHYNCDNNKCAIDINILSNLNKPMYLPEETLLNLNNKNIDNITSCKFTRLGASYLIEGENPWNINNNCDSNSCDLEIYKRIKKNREYIFRMQLYLDSGGVIKRHFVNIYAPIKVNATFFISC